MDYLIICTLFDLSEPAGLVGFQIESQTVVPGIDYFAGGQVA
jgi:hypothetical protein